jgi:hypothetical protein
VEQTGADAHTGFGAEPNRSFGLAMADVRPGGSILHLPLHCVEVDACHRAGLAAGGTDNRAPGLRPHYHANIYGTFLLDPDGNNI